MNKTLLSTMLLTIICTSAQAAEATPAANKPAAAAPTQAAPAADKASPAETTINCKYRLTAETTAVETNLLTNWAGKATVQAFDFNPTTIDNQLLELKPCFTDQGWHSFNDALQKSGNVAAIKTQHLNVSSQIDGEVKVNAVKDNQWKITVPLQVVYQNDKEKLTQLLTVDLLVGRKVTGDLGIMQLIASPRPAAGQKQMEPAKPANQPANPSQDR